MTEPTTDPKQRTAEEERADVLAFIRANMKRHAEHEAAMSEARDWQLVLRANAMLAAVRYLEACIIRGDHEGTSTR